MEGHYTERNLSALADKIRESRADVVCLQEVDVGAARSDRVDMPARLSEMTGIPYHFFIKIRDFQGGEYGTAVLSRYPILESKTILFPVQIATQGTSCGYVVLDFFGTAVTVFNTHLSVESDEANTECMTCLRDILQAYTDTHDGPVVCCGDFNEQPPKVARIIPWMKRAHEGLITYGQVSIDHILYLNCTVHQVRTMDTQYDRTTDHNMLLCNVTAGKLFKDDEPLGKLETLLGSDLDISSLLDSMLANAPEPEEGSLDPVDLMERLECKMDEYDSVAEGLSALSEAARTFYVAATFNMEYLNGGLCQFFVNSSREVAPLVSDALFAIGAVAHQTMFDQFVRANHLDLTDLSDWKIRDVCEYADMESRLHFDAFNDAFAKLPCLDDLLDAFVEAHAAELHAE